MPRSLSGTARKAIALLCLAAAAGIAGAAQADRPRAIETADVDGDGVDDALEDRLAERFAPIVFHGESESTYPVSVDWLLSRTTLREYGVESPGRSVSDQASLAATVRPAATPAPTNDEPRSTCKRSGWFLADVAEPDRAGERDNPRDWKTYVHAYRNVHGGVTIQYWRAYAYDRTTILLVDWGHGGDWEGLAVHLDASEQPESVGLLGHLGIDRRAAGTIAWEGTHPIVWSEEGGHATRADSKPLSSRRFTRQETWSGGRIVWFDGRRAEGGGLVNVGEKTHPRNGQQFIQYAGMWGSPHRLFVTSGYWGPAFNETGSSCDDGQSAYRMSLSCGARSGCGRIFHTAWCDGMSPTPLDRSRECYAPAGP